MTTIELQPDWATAPEWAIAHTTDADGYTQWHECDPAPGADIEWWSHGRTEPDLGAFPNWRNSLQQRPEPEPEPDTYTRLSQLIELAEAAGFSLDVRLVAEELEPDDNNSWHQMAEAVAVLTEENEQLRADLADLRLRIASVVE